MTIEQLLWKVKRGNLWRKIAKSRVSLQGTVHGKQTIMTDLQTFSNEQRNCDKYVNNLLGKMGKDTKMFEYPSTYFLFILIAKVSIHIESRNW